MTLLIHSTKTETGYSVAWAMQSGSVCGTHDVAIDHDNYDARACAEIQALSVVLETFPGKAGNIQSSNSMLRNILSAKETKYGYAATEMGNLQIRHSNLNITSDKKTTKMIQAILSQHEEVRCTSDSWRGLGRPVVNTSIEGEVEVTYHAMMRYRERFAKTGDLERLEKVLSKPFGIQSVVQKGGKTYKVFKSKVSDFMFVIAEYADQKRLTTCYRAA